MVEISVTRFFFGGGNMFEVGSKVAVRAIAKECLETVCLCEGEKCIGTVKSLNPVEIGTFNTEVEFSDGSIRRFRAEYLVPANDPEYLRVTLTEEKIADLAKNSPLKKRPIPLK